ncbi:MAG: hypothetical protein E7G87_01745, partial [Bifidobacterium longum]|nr:hypothetical protein [Bifidobacterium longum]
RGEIQLHRTLSFLKTEHTKIFPFGLQENVRSPLSPLAAEFAFVHVCLHVRYIFPSELTGTRIIPP